MLIDVDPDDLYSGKIDGEGRKYLSRDLAGKEVVVALVEVRDPPDVYDGET